MVEEEVPGPGGRVVELEKAREVDDVREMSKTGGGCPVAVMTKSL